MDAFSGYPVLALIADAKIGGKGWLVFRRHFSR